MAYAIRQAGSEDANTLVELIRTGFRDVAQRFGLTKENCPAHPSNCSLEWVKADLCRGVKYLILEQGGSPVGCVAVEKASPRVCYVERLAVLPESRHKGFGRALMRHAIGLAKGLGVARVEIGIISRNVELKDWYERMGFVVAQTKSFPHLPLPSDSHGSLSLAASENGDDPSRPREMRARLVEQPQPPGLFAAVADMTDHKGVGPRSDFFQAANRP